MDREEIIVGKLISDWISDWIKENASGEEPDLEKLTERFKAEYRAGPDNYDIEEVCRELFDRHLEILRSAVEWYEAEPRVAEKILEVIKGIEQHVIPLAESVGYLPVYKVYRIGLSDGETIPPEELKRAPPRHRRIMYRDAVKTMFRQKAKRLWSNPHEYPEWDAVEDKRIGSMAAFLHADLIKFIKKSPGERTQYLKAIPKNPDDIKAILKEHPSVVPEWALRGGRPKSK